MSQRAFGANRQFGGKGRKGSFTAHDATEVVDSPPNRTSDLPYRSNRNLTLGPATFTGGRSVPSFKLSANLAQSYGSFENSNRQSSSFQILNKMSTRSKLSTANRQASTLSTGFNLGSRLRGDLPGSATFVSTRTMKKNKQSTKINLPAAPSSTRMNSIQREAYVPKKKNIKGVQKIRMQKNFRSGSHTQMKRNPNFGNESAGTVGFADEDEESQDSFNEETPFEPKGQLKNLRDKRMKELDNSNEVLSDTGQTLPEEDDDSFLDLNDVNGPYIPRGTTFKNLTAKHQQEALNGHIRNVPSANNRTGATLFSDEGSFSESEAGVSRNVSKKKSEVSSKRKRSVARTTQLGQLSRNSEFKTEEFVNRISRVVPPGMLNHRSVSINQQQSSFLRGPSRVLSMAQATNARGIVEQIQERQREQDEMISKLYKSRRFREAERRQRPSNTALPANIRASMSVNITPLLPNSQVAASLKETKTHNRAKHAQKHGMHGFFACSTVGQACDRTLDLFALVPYDCRVVFAIFIIACAAAYVVFYFTADYAVDPVSLE